MHQFLIGRVYRHFKGDYYLAEATAKDSETGQEMAIYRKLYGDGELWVRPMDMFLEKVDKNKYPNADQLYRFELVEIPGKAHPPDVSSC